MDRKYFYNSSYRRVTHAYTMSEVRNLVETMERPISIVLVPRGAGDEYNQESIYLFTAKHFDLMATDL